MLRVWVMPTIQLGDLHSNSSKLVEIWSNQKILLCMIIMPLGLMADIDQISSRVKTI